MLLFLSLLFILSALFFLTKNVTREQRSLCSLSRQIWMTTKFCVRAVFVGPLDKLSTRTHQHTKRPSVAHNSVSRIQSDRKLYFLIACSKLKTIKNYSQLLSVCYVVCSYFCLCYLFSLLFFFLALFRRSLLVVLLDIFFPRNNQQV